MLSRKRVRRYAAVLSGSLFGILGFLDGCNDRLVGITRFVDPCGTILANCAPGTFELQAAGIGDFCVDPTCSIPGLCGPIPDTDFCP